MSVIEKMLGGPSLYDLLDQHREKSFECVQRIQPMLEASRGNDFNRLKTLAEEVFVLEREADHFKTQIRDNLPRTKWMAVSRYDFLALLRAQDSLADAVEDLAMMLRLKPLRLPELCDGLPCLDELATMAENAVRSAEDALELTHAFCTGRHKGFDTETVDQLKKGSDRISAFEFETDKNQFRLLRAMLSDEDEESSFGEKYVTMEVIRNLGRIANHAESMTDFMRLMIAE
ncbi:DUF47 family protein [bacterium]|nr:DUF47 family protein [bacterium]